MTKRKPTTGTGLIKLMDSIIENILSASDEDILDDDKYIVGRGSPTAEEFIKRGIRDARIAEGKMRFREVANQLAHETQSGAKIVVPLRPKILRNLHASDANELKSRGIGLSLAARNGKRMSDRDYNSAVDDLRELGAFNPEETAEK